MNAVEVLLVDDIKENVLALQALLKPLGVTYLAASSGAEALELLLHHEVALALIDVQMPEMDGFELAEYMRSTAKTRAIPIVFLTAARDPSRVFRGYEAGAVDFLYKPLDPGILTSKVTVFVELYRQRRQLAEKVLQLEESLRMNELFMAVLGHDLRSPLSAVAWGAEQLLLKPDDVSMVDSVAKRIRNSASRMERLVTDITDTARVRSGQGLVLERVPCDLQEIVARVVEEQDAGFGRCSVRISGDTNGSWDPGRLLQVVTNLVSNALEHGDNKEPVDIRVDGRGEQVTLTVHNGGAIPVEVQASVFEPFRTTRKVGSRRGLGLGLYIVDQIVKSHGGSIHLSSDPHKGTTLVVALRRHPESVVAARRDYVEHLNP